LASILNGFRRAVACMSGREVREAAAAVKREIFGSVGRIPGVFRPPPKPMPS